MSSEHNGFTSHQLARILDRVRGAYPHGIPRAAIRPKLSAPSLDNGVATVLFVVFSESPIIPPEHETLLDSIVTKGLKVSPERAFRCVVRNDHEYAAATQKHLTLHGEAVVVALGGPQQDGNLEQIGTALVLNSHPLDAIARDAAVKKSFWGHLQRVLGRLT